MTREEAIDILNDERIVIWTEPDEEEIARKQNEAIDMAIESLSADAVQGVGRYENAMQKLRDMPKYLNGVKEKQITKTSADYTTEKPNDVVEQKNDVVAEPTDLISRADAIALLTKIVFDEPPYLDSETLCRLYAEEQINALPSADRPTELLKDGTLKVKTDNGADVKRVLVWGDDGCGGLYYADDRPSGEWVKHNDRSTIIVYYTCSECGEIESGTPPYCRKCGAKMGSDVK